MPNEGVSCAQSYKILISAKQATMLSNYVKISLTCTKKFTILGLFKFLSDGGSNPANLVGLFQEIVDDVERLTSGVAALGHVQINPHHR
jgi:hypothetical protein